MDLKRYIGCSGYYYSAWKNGFYPKGLKPAEWLTFYSSIFKTVELNGTFYRKPTLAALKKYYNNTPAEFKFSVKMSRFVSHIKRLNNCDAEIADFHHLIEEGLQDKLRCMLYQMPPSFHFNEENLNRVLQAIKPSHRNVIEFRHISWWAEGIPEQISAHGITMCNVDFPGLDSLIINTTPIFYLRMHGNPVLFKSKYSIETLKEIKEQICKEPSLVYIYFNNTYFDGGYTNALQMQQLFNKGK